jgi:hypothetical protein
MEWGMDRPGMRYRNLANRCRQTAARSQSPADKVALLRMAEGYDRRADDLEKDWALKVEVAQSLQGTVTHAAAEPLFLMPRQESLRST